MNILITGGTGFIGSKLTKSLIKQGHNVTILSRDPNKVSALFGSMVTALSDLRQLTPDSSYQVIINLAGAPIFDARWSEARKQLLTNSRIDLTTQLVESMSCMHVKPDVFISGSAIGYYGDQGDNILTEQSASRADFSQQLCADWEAAAISAEKYGIRVCIIRTGLVLADGGGLLQRMLLPFRLCLGGRLGEGNQWMSWIHRQDWIAIAEIMIADNSMHGAYNATAPNPVTNNEFTKILAACLKRPALLPVPAWLLKTLLGEMSELVLGSQRVIPDRLLAYGFKFQYPNLADAINQTLHSVNE